MWFGVLVELQHPQWIARPMQLFQRISVNLGLERISLTSCPVDNGYTTQE